MENSWEETLDVDDSDVRSLTRVLHPCKHQRHTVDSSSRTIPGPAGIFQTAKLRKTRVNVANPMEYIRKVVDDDFKRSPWVSAVEYVNAEGVRNASLGDINKYQKGKLDEDPTGSVSGTIHHKVLTDTEFAKGICVGSVLILRKVSVFSPSPSAHYLNITTRNLVKVFYMDGGTSQTHTSHGFTIMDAAPSSDSGRDAQMVRSHERGVEGIMNAFRSSSNANQGKHFENGQENVNPVDSIAQNCSKTSEKGTNQKEILEEADGIEIDEHEVRSCENVMVATERNKIEVKGRNQIEDHVDASTISGCVPVWTDEQLNELSAGDMEL